MSKLNLEKRLEILKEAKKLNVKKSTSIASKYNISTSTMRDIVIRYELFGPSGLMDKHNKHVYTPEQKLKIVLYKIKNNKTYYEVAKKFKITNHSIVANWVKKYKKDGFLGLNNNRGRPKKYMNNFKKDKRKKSKLKNHNDDRVKELKKELEYYKLENEYLKKLHTLLEKKQPTRKKQK